MQKVNGSLYGVNNVAPKFTSKEKSEKSIGNQSTQVEEGYSGKQVGGAVLATALSAVVLAGGVIRGKSKSIKALEKHVSELANETSGLRRDVNSLTGENAELKSAKETLESVNSQLREEADKVKKQLQDVLDSSFGSGDDDAKILSKIKNKIDNAELDYDIEHPPVTGVKEFKRYNRGFDYESTVVGTTNRAHIKDVDIPEITSEGRFDFELPVSKDMKITKVDTVDFQPMKNVSTSISENYADSVQWDNDKIARDVLQNFFDGHGQTMDGVRIKFEPAQNGKYKIRIEGKSTYTPDKAVYIGESTKRGDSKAAGNYGEGLKMAALKLLRDKGAEGVKIGSDNWELAYSLERGNLSDKRVLSYSLDKVDKYNGNYVEFETSDKDLLEKFRTTINRFYNSGNTHFKCPDFENETFGIKVLPNPNEKGALYIAGQRFEFEGNYDGLKGVALFIKEKPPVKVLDPSRDRTSINESQLTDIASWLTKEKTTEQEKMEVVKTLERYMDKKSSHDATSMDNFLDRFVLYADTSFRPINRCADFPEHFVAYSDSSPEFVQELKNNGYKICKSSFKFMGMRTISDLVGNARKHTAIKPTEIQEKKILIIKEALKKLSPSLKDKHFSDSELNPSIYLFDKNGSNENSMYKDCLAEAITDFGKSKGFWIDGKYLDNSSFSEVLETALHELSHKVGGDESAEFSYKLTDVNKEAISQLLNNADSRKELQALNTLWKNLSE